MLRCAHPSSLRRTKWYASFLGMSRALHLGIFEQALPLDAFGPSSIWAFRAGLLALADGKRSSAALHGSFVAATNSVGWGPAPPNPTNHHHRSRYLRTRPNEQNLPNPVPTRPIPAERRHGMCPSNMRGTGWCAAWRGVVGQGLTHSSAFSHESFCKFWVHPT